MSKGPGKGHIWSVASKLHLRSFWQLTVHIIPHAAPNFHTQHKERESPQTKPDKKGFLGFISQFPQPDFWWLI